ncbi:MAG: hypothetical protein U0547_12510 [Dehalococcoidia bacterium]
MPTISACPTWAWASSTTSSTAATASSPSASMRPGEDMEAEMRREGVPLWGLETAARCASSTSLASPSEYELTYSNVVNMLDLGGIPIRARDRGDEHPLVIAGGSGAFNQRPLSAFIDAFVLGEGEDAVVELAERVASWKRERTPRGRRLRDLLSMPGVYVLIL